MSPSTRAGLLALLPALVLVTACTDEWAAVMEDHDHGGDPFFTEWEWEEIRSLAGVPEVPDEPSSNYSDDPPAARFGQLLYFDAGYSPPDDNGEPHSCASCHEPTQWFTRPDDEANASRNITSVLNIAYYDFHTWNGKRDSLWSFALTPAEGFLKSTRLRIAHHIAEKYRDEYACVFEFNHDEDTLFFDWHEEFPAEGRPKKDNEAEGSPGWEYDQNWDGLLEDDQEVVNRIFANYGKAVAAYMRRIVSGETRFDAYVLGTEEADDGDDRWGGLSPSEKRGLKLFLNEANCIACHKGQMFTDNEFHNIAVPREPETPEARYEGLGDLNKWNLSFGLESDFSDHPEDAPTGGYDPSDDDRGAYRTPSLRNVEMTGRYMHAGQFATLREVLEHYNDPPDPDEGAPDHDIWPLGLTPNDINDLEAFLETLTSKEAFAGPWAEPPTYDWDGDLTPRPSICDEEGR